MSKSSEYWDKRAMQRLTETEKQSEVYIKRIKGVYQKAYRDINRELESVYANYSKETGLEVQRLKELLTKSETKKTWEQLKKQGLDKYVKDNYKSRISRLEQIQAQIYARAKEVFTEEELQSTMHYNGVVHDSYNKAIYDVQKGTGYAFDFNRLDDNMVKRVLNEPWSGKNYSERIWKNTDILAEKVAETVGGAILSGQGIEKTSRQIREQFGVAKHYAERLVRTETNHFHNEADAMAYEEMGVEYYVFVATLDNRTSDICQDHDLKRYKVSERKEGYNYPPLHPNCRSTTRSWLGEEVEQSLQRRARDPITGKSEVIGNMPYSEWYKQKVEGENADTSVKNTDKSAKKNIEKSSKKGYNENETSQAVKSIFDGYNIEHIRAKPLKAPLTGEQIIKRLGGGDETDGSCASVALAYVGNKAGLDVLDFRGGNSQKFFASFHNLTRIGLLESIDADFAVASNSLSTGNKLMRKVITGDEGQEYFMAVGRHAAIVRKTSGGILQFLELQDPKNNGWTDFYRDVSYTLSWRFACDRENVGADTGLIVSVDKLKKSNEFKQVLGYLNTNANAQQKGDGGSAK